jgi:hypothetical protein
MRADDLSRWAWFGAALLWSLLSLRARPGRPVAPKIATPERLRAAGLLSLALILLAPADALRAQEETVEPQVVVPPGTTVRSFAQYDPGDRRDPFVPMFNQAANGDTGPRFETLKLTGIFLGSGTNSLAVLEDPTNRGYFVRLGQQIGTARLVEILPQAAVFEVREYGASRRIVLRLERTEESR